MTFKACFSSYCLKLDFKLTGFKTYPTILYVFLSDRVPLKTLFKQNDTLTRIYDVYFFEVLCAE